MIAVHEIRLRGPVHHAAVVLAAIGQELGHVEREIAETDMVTFAFGIALGVAVGMPAIREK